MRKRLRAAQDEHREHLARLRELRKTQVESAPGRSSKGSGGKAVQWKDGMKSQTSRNRKVLEQVFIFVKNTPANKDMNEPAEDEENGANAAIDLQEEEESEDATMEIDLTRDDGDDMELWL